MSDTRRRSELRRHFRTGSRMAGGRRSGPPCSTCQRKRTGLHRPSRPLWRSDRGTGTRSWRAWLGDFAFRGCAGADLCAGAGSSAWRCCPARSGLARGSQAGYLRGVTLGGGPMRDHGGNLDQAMACYGAGNWIDLSTGINRRPWPVPALSAAAWRNLPTKAAQAAFGCAGRSLLGRSRWGRRCRPWRRTNGNPTGAAPAAQGPRSRAWARPITNTPPA